MIASLSCSKFVDMLSFILVGCIGLGNSSTGVPNKVVIKCRNDSSLQFWVYYGDGCKELSTDQNNKSPQVCHAVNDMWIPMRSGAGKGEV